jgi:hypothetical protein
MLPFIGQIKGNGNHVVKVHWVFLLINDLQNGYKSYMKFFFHANYTPLFIFHKGMCVMENGVTLTFERPLIREPNWRFFEPFCVCDGRLCITSAWVVPWLRIYDGCTEWTWSLDGGSELWLGIMLHLWRMAVWKREEEDNALEEEDRTR